jgi:hypothetical protein
MSLINNTLIEIISDCFIVNLVFFTAENFALPGEAGFPLNAFYPKPNK